MIDVIQKYSAKLILGLFDFLVHRYTGDSPIVKEKDIPFLNTLQQNRESMLNEYLSIVRHKELNNIKDFYKVKKNINEDEKWKAEPLILYNYIFLENLEKCPKTYEVLKAIPGCSAAMFSVLEPGKYIPPHKGIYKGIYRCLFILQIDEGADCWIRVNEVKTHFQTGTIIVFDETAEHEVMNASSSKRVALYLDILRKFPFPLDVINKFLYYLIRRSPFVTNILKEYKKLEEVTVAPYSPSDPILK